MKERWWQWKRRRRVLRLVRSRKYGDSEVREFRIGGGWGNCVRFQDFDRGMVYGFVPWDLIGANLRRPLPGDLLLMETTDGCMVFRFVDVEWLANPSDMFTGTVEPEAHFHATIRDAA